MGFIKNMNNNINFTGISNIGGLGQIAVDFRTMRPLQRRYMIAQLTNDFYGKDYDKYRKAVNSCKDIIGENSFELEPHFMHIMTEKPLKEDVVPKLFLNSKEIPVCDKTLKLYEFLAKFTRTISKMKPEQYDIKNDFKYGPDGDMFVMGDSCISDFCKSKEQYIATTDKIYNADNVKKVAKAINDEIQAKMEKFFD
ncbi:MAG: hypothetical protein SPL73_08320 [Cyanobacteriota bacterium]|nr:hypothetical protein [Cyanobacteriota bacterium]MDY6358702.1 hypothetical protein [Cyanobacteriota bacterium]MDY6364875.1 hypothetical protein [Cyanobacteriota bacterium]MDY6383081.1 hypothetical protein [Cyanobacteriota bacterium]